ncbi:MAG TPA: LamG domain-containing protein [Polyangia bacterium]|nr:LamG domain-containing protein [Polyangia bacterium]
MKPIPRASTLRRFVYKRSHDILWLAVATAGLAACGGGTGENRADLDAILADGDLTQIQSAALTRTPTPGGAGGSTGVAGATGAGGATFTGMGGTPATGGFTGTGGAVDTGGFTGGGGFTGMGGFGGFGGQTGPFLQVAQGFWKFDDCNMSRTELLDSTFNGHTAFRAVSAACATGIDGQGLAIAHTDDLVYVPDQPTFTFDNGLTVAAWVKPTKLGGVRTIFRKREDGTSTFVLAENGKTYQLVIRLANGRAADVSAPATLNTFTHVAGTYDGKELRLYLNGKLAAKTRVTGKLSGGQGPLLMGNDASGRRLDGVIDSVFFDTIPATPDEIVRLTCIPRPSKLVAVPTTSGLLAAGTSFQYDLQLTNNACDESTFETFASSSNNTVTASTDNFFAVIEPGATQHIVLDVSSSTETEPDDYPISVTSFSFDKGEQLSTTVTYSVQGTPCSVRSRKELEIRDLSVVEDPVRTAAGGAWTFGKLMEAMAPTAAQAPDMVEGLLDTWLTDQPVGGFTVAARPSIQDVVLSSFPRTADGKLDLSKAPFRLLAIANRIDLNDVTNGTAGEGRFAFGLLDPSGNPLQMTMIVEYRIPAATAKDVTDLADAWHGLSNLPFPSESYNVALQAVTDRFTKRGAAPGRINGSALGQIRSNDFFTLGEWEFREFHLGADGMLHPAGPALTPDASLNGTQALADFINQNEPAILAQTHTVPATFEGQPFQAGSMITDFFTWNADGINNPEAREKFALNTCNGCHTSGLETNTFVFQLSPRFQGQETQLSPFLQGTQVFDPFSNVLRNFNELGRRGRVLHDLVCPNDPLPPPPPDTTPVDNGDGGFGGAGGFGDFDGGGTGGATGSSDSGVVFPVSDGGVSGAGGATGFPGKV